jgi:hypothetical protein
VGLGNHRRGRGCGRCRTARRGTTPCAAPRGQSPGLRGIRTPRGLPLGIGARHVSGEPFPIAPSHLRSASPGNIEEVGVAGVDGFDSSGDEGATHTRRGARPRGHGQVRPVPVWVQRVRRAPSVHELLRSRGAGRARSGCNCPPPMFLVRGHCTARLSGAIMLVPDDEIRDALRATCAGRPGRRGDGH